MTEPLLRAEELVRRYRRPRLRPWLPPEAILALAGVNLAVDAGAHLGIVGESGSGKSTLARLVMALERPDAGRVWFAGRDLGALPERELRELRRGFQIVFQDPYGSLDPRQSVGRIIGEPLDRRDGSAPERAALVEAALAEVGLRRGDAGKYPHEFSGGQRQRVAIARALVTRPRLIVADEPVSALDVSVQAQILELFATLAAERGVTYLFISHDLAVIETMTTRLAVLFRGAVVESGATRDILAAPRHPYTQALKDAVPRFAPGRRRARLGAAAAASVAVDVATAGCPYATRCPRAEARCRVEAPALREVAPGWHAACHFA
jgi:peptide/nickel transport system ATP-binding protein